MKSIILATILGLAAVGSANAMTDNGNLSAGVKSQAEYILPGASFDNLTATQAARIEGLFTGGKDRVDNDIKQSLMKALAS